MAEGFSKYYFGNRWEVASAGTDPVGLNPDAVQAMNEVGIDIRHQRSKPLSTFVLSDFDCVVTLCGDARDHCPALPAGVGNEHWDLPDPSRSGGTPLEVLKAFRIVRSQVEHRVKKLFLRKVGSQPTAAKP